ncbi:PaaI family thioesterase [Sphingomonas sp. GC_Shp_3]|uniref:PaaI family thioesterase n=1 Tax=Sphingomonas sp. GC_Shp_3 TaxID=2937383 RepID=UPI00226A5E8F|nr:PaaI family thioesterase [Sphingomonas sp. GC_Shp_3]
MALPDPSSFVPEDFADMMEGHHGGHLGIEYRAHGPDWAELALPYREALIGDLSRGVLASGPILALMDSATSFAVRMKVGVARPHATLDLRIDYVRPATPGRTVIGRGECYRVTRAISFVRGVAHDGDPADPIANVAGTFMFTDL